MSQQLARRWFSVSEYNRMAEARILTEQDRVELIEGDIVEMSPIGSKHAACVNRLNAEIVIQIGQSYIISVQNPIVVSDFSEPEPDVSVLRRREDYYANELPTAADVLLVIEVADTSVEYDRGTKIPIYAKSGIAESVLVNLSKDVVEFHSQPANGQYQSVKILKRGEMLKSVAVNGLTISADSILGQSGI